MSKVRLSEEYLNEREAIDSLFNFEGEDRKARWQNRKNLIIFEVDIDTYEYSEYDGEYDDATNDILEVTIVMKIPKSYPKKSPFELRFKNIKNIDDEQVKELRKRIMSAIRISKKSIVCLEITEIAKSYLEELNESYTQSPIKEYSTVDLIELAKKEKEKRKNAYLKKKNRERNEVNQNSTKGGSSSHIVFISDPKLEKNGITRIDSKEEDKTKIMDNVELELAVRKSTKMKVKKVNLSHWKTVSLKPTDISYHHKTSRAKGVFAKESYRFDVSHALRRIDYTLTKVSHCLVLIGGRSGKKNFDDFIRFNFRSKEITSFRGLCVAGNRRPFETPYLTDHIAFAHKNTSVIVIYPNTSLREMSVFCVSDILSKPFVGVNVEVKKVNPMPVKQFEQRRVRLGNSKVLPLVREYGYTWVRSSLYIFGGALNVLRSRLSNRLFQISFTGMDYAQQPTFMVKEIVPVAMRDDDGGGVSNNFMPCPRRGHRCSALKYNLYVFGGINDRGQYLNDLHCYNFSTDRWSEIQIGFTPPPMAFHAMYNTGPSFCIFGGTNKQGIRSKQMYSFDTREQKFFVMNPLNRSASDCLGRSGMVTVRVTSDRDFTSSGRIYVGGRTQESGVLSDMSFIEYSNDQGKRLQVLGYLDDCRKKKLFVDIHFIMQVSVKSQCDEDDKNQEKEEVEGEDDEDEDEDEEEEEEMKLEEEYAHSCVLSIRCPSFFEYILRNSEIEENYTDADADPTIKQSAESNRVMYHIRIGKNDPVLGNRPRLLRSWLRFLYTGDVIVKSNVGDFLDLARKFSPERLYPVLAKLCSKRRRYLDICGEIVNQICDDFRKLYTSDEDENGVLLHHKEFDDEKEEEEEEEFEDNMLPPEIPSIGLYEDDDDEDDEDEDTQETAEEEKEEKKKKDHSKYYHSDLRLVFADGTVKHVHRVFLCQSKYFKSMLQSQFKEATQSEIEFDQFNKEAILDILSYIYTGFLEMSPQNCVGVLIYSLQFELLEVSTACRRVVEEHLEHDTVVELINLAELYVDQYLKSICKSYIVRNYDEVTKMPGYEDIESRTRQEIFQEHSKRKMRERKKKMKKSKKFMRENN